MSLMHEIGSRTSSYTRGGIGTASRTPGLSMTLARCASRDAEWRDLWRPSRRKMEFWLIVLREEALHL